MKLNVLAFALAAGIIFAIYFFCLGLCAWQFDWGTPLVEVVGSLYIGYATTLLGSVIGAIWAFADAFIGALILALLYNWIAPSRN
ncbi:MAG: hypothetical protein B1H03_01530 [Planctomycetales bacterium 4484_113]|nr:MAG: hypothetical protein B1H03_01530 [Planctomycetales bacterium 4484_113]